MQNITISHPSEPALMRPYAIIPPSEDDTDVLVSETETEPEFVDFHLTALAVTALKDTLTWSKIIAGCISFFMLLEVIVLGFVFVKYGALISSVSASGILQMAPTFVSLGLYCWIMWQCIKFNREMDRALKFNDNPALAAAFRHQDLMFKWLFVSIVFSFAKSVIESVL